MVELRPYQREVVDLIRKNKRVLVVWRPGAGKTWFSAYLLCHSEELLGIKPPHLVVTPSVALHSTWLEYLKRFCSNVGRVKLATYQGVAVNPSKFRGHWGIIVSDEAHHLPAEKYRVLLSLGYDKMLMVTATPIRREEGTERTLFGFADVVHEVPWVASETENVKIVVYVVRSEEDRLRTLKLLVDNILLKPLIVYTEYIRDCINVSRILGTRCLSGETTRKLGLKGERVANWLKVMFNSYLYSGPRCVVMTRIGEEGLDIPNLKSIVEYGWLGASHRQVLQRMGRLLHVEGGKYVILTKYGREYELILNRIVGLRKKGYRVEIVKG